MRRYLGLAALRAMEVANDLWEGWTTERAKRVAELDKRRKEADERRLARGSEQPVPKSDETVYDKSSEAPTWHERIADDEEP